MNKTHEKISLLKHHIHLLINQEVYRNELIYKLQFGFRQKHSTSHALINLTETIREELDKGNFACGIFVDFQKAFDTVDHNILIQKLRHYGIRGTANDWFASYLNNRKQYVSINGFNSDLLTYQLWRASRLNFRSLTVFNIHK